MVPAHAVAEIRLKTVVEIVKPLAEGEQGEPPRIACRGAVVVGLVAADMRERINEKSPVMHKYRAQQRTPKKKSERASDDKTDQQRNSPTDDRSEPFVVTILPHHPFIFEQVGDVVVNATIWLFVQNPTDVRMPKTSFRIVGIGMRIHVQMMMPMIRRPLQR